MSCQESDLLRTFETPPTEPGSYNAVDARRPSLERLSIIEPPWSRRKWVRLVLDESTDRLGLVSDERRINKQYCTDRIRCDYPHVGLYDVKTSKLWIAKRKWGVSPIQVSHAKLLVGGTQDTSTQWKDHFICYWFNTPNTGDGYVQGYPIEWDEGHLQVRIDPNWDYYSGVLIKPTETAKGEMNIERQFNCGHKIFDAYLALKPKFPISLHMIGPRPTDSMFYVQREEPKR